MINNDKIRSLLPLIKEMVGLLTEISVDAAENEISDNLSAISRQMRNLIVLESKSKEYRKMLGMIRVGIKRKHGKTKRESVQDTDPEENKP